MTDAERRRPKLLSNEEFQSAERAGQLASTSQNPLGDIYRTIASAQIDHDAAHYEKEIARLEAALAEARRETADCAIGKLCRNYYLAEAERVKARIARAKARESHKCVVEHEYYEDDTGASEHFCYNQYVREPTPFEEWCDNCKYVQTYHLAYREAAKKAQVAKHQLTRAIQRSLARLTILPEPEGEKK